MISGHRWHYVALTVSAVYEMILTLQAVELIVANKKVDNQIPKG